MRQIEKIRDILINILAITVIMLLQIITIVGGFLAINNLIKGY